MSISSQQLFMRIVSNSPSNEPSTPTPTTTSTSSISSSSSPTTANAAGSINTGGNNVTENDNNTDGGADDSVLEDAFTEELQSLGSSSIHPLSSSSYSPGSNRNAIKLNRKSTSNWFKLQLLNPSYKTRYEEFKKIFAPTIGPSEKLVVDYSCALNRELIIHGRIYLSLNYICFHSTIFNWTTSVVIAFRDIESIIKTNTVKFIPNAIQVKTKNGEKHEFTSFVTRDKTYMMMFRIWQNALLEQPMTPTELWQHLHDGYGKDLGFTSEEEEKYVNMVEEDIGTDAISQKSDQSTAGAVNKVSNSKKHKKSASISETMDDSKSNEKSLPDSIAEMLVTRGGSQSEETVNLCGEDVNSDDHDAVRTEQMPLIDISPANCCHSLHDGVELMNQSLPMSVDEVFNLIFADGPFFRTLLAKRRTHDISVSEWEDIENQEGRNGANNSTNNDFNKSRCLSFTMELNQTMAKTVNTTEIQYLHAKSIPGQVYMVKSEATNSGVPFSNSFQVNTFFCLTRGKHAKECTLRVHGQVIFKKSAWGMKSFIEDSSIQGISSYCDDLINSLLEWRENVDEGKPLGLSEVTSFLTNSINNKGEPKASLLGESIVVTCTPISLSNSLKRRKRGSSTTTSASSSLSPRSHHHHQREKSSAAGSRDSTLKSSRDRSTALRITVPSSKQSITTTLRTSNIDSLLIRAVLVILVILLVLNCFLHIRLWRLEESAKVLQSLIHSTPSSAAESSFKQFSSEL